MSIEEANEIIAKYMGYTRFNEGWNTNTKGDGIHWVCYDWFKSLDNLIPVWQKLENHHLEGIKINLAIKHVELYTFPIGGYGHSTSESFDFSNSTPQEIALLATAKVIQEIECLK